MSNAMAAMLIGPGSLVPWWAWLAPLAMIFLKLLSPVLLPEVAEAKLNSEADEEKEKGKKGKKNKKDKKSQKK
ncbi:hypothetical protein [Actinoplanes couchii]|uniref:hypothetical protein n=1 Tax=Actinoplanes couchii TaxID=403638 RepID=UPI0019428AB4|nr:hypothetical protein [Actinoplanes couchii]MDR6322763.1 multisubunit Na+/H+ antiporter MnhG subunit [Actinoplanes couchii]